MTTLLEMIKYLGNGFLFAVVMYVVIIVVCALILSIKETAEENKSKSPLIYTLLVLALIILVAIIFVKLLPYMLMGILICIGMGILFLGLIFIYELIKIIVNSFRK